jgi:protein ImuA
MTIFGFNMGLSTGHTLFNKQDGPIKALIEQMPNALWRGNQTAFHQRATLSSGFMELDQELPQGGWPDGAMIELLVQQSGIGEIRLLQPALRTITKKRRIALVQPPHLPQISAWRNWGLPPERLFWVKADSTADALWSADQILHNGSCGALVLWQNQMRNEWLRRLHLAAQDTDMLFWIIRPLSAAQDASPSPLRLGLRPARQGITVDFVKRRGAVRDTPLLVQLHDLAAPLTTVSNSDHALLDQSVPSVARARSISAELV